MPPVPRYTSAAAYPPATSFSGTAKSRPWSRALEAQCCPARNWWEFTARMWWWLINTRLICLWVRCCRQKVLPANQALKARCWGGVGLRCGWVGREALSSVLLALFFFFDRLLSPFLRDHPFSSWLATPSWRLPHVSRLTSIVGGSP